MVLYRRLLLLLSLQAWFFFQSLNHEKHYLILSRSPRVKRQPSQSGLQSGFLFHQQGFALPLRLCSVFPQNVRSEIPRVTVMLASSQMTKPNFAALQQLWVGSVFLFSCWHHLWILSIALFKLHLHFSSHSSLVRSWVFESTFRAWISRHPSDSFQQHLYLYLYSRQSVCVCSFFLSLPLLFHCILLRVFSCSDSRFGHCGPILVRHFAEEIERRGLRLFLLALMSVGTNLQEMCWFFVKGFSLPQGRKFLGIGLVTSHLPTWLLCWVFAGSLRWTGSRRGGGIIDEKKMERRDGSGRNKSKDKCILFFWHCWNFVNQSFFIVVFVSQSFLCLFMPMRRHCFHFLLAQIMISCCFL